MKIQSIVQSQHVTKDIFDILMLHSTLHIDAYLRPILGSDAREYLIYLPDESGNIRLAAFAHMHGTVNTCEYCHWVEAGGQTPQNSEWSREAAGIVWCEQNWDR